MAHKPGLICECAALLMRLSCTYCPSVAVRVVVLNAGLSTVVFSLAYDTFFLDNFFCLSMRSHIARIPASLTFRLYFLSHDASAVRNWHIFKASVHF